MPVEFLTQEQKARYGKFIDEPTNEQLAVYFLLDDNDKKASYNHRGDYNRIGFAIQRENLEKLLMVDDKNKTGLESLRQPVTHESPIGFLKAIERMPYERRMATLVAFAIVYTTSAQDDVIDYMERYFLTLFNRANRKGQKSDR